MQSRRATAISFLVTGLLLLGVALLADQMGLSQYGGWSRSRILIFVIGCFTSIAAYVALIFSNQVNYYQKQIDNKLNNLPWISHLWNSQLLIKIRHLFHQFGFSLPSFAIVILTYIWLASSGTWTAWNSPTRYYADLARGFQQGVLHIPTRVDPILLDLENPYDPDTRVGVKAPIDISYFKGKYYLYWGPVPAVFLAMVSPFIHGRVGDMQIFFAFATGIFIIQALLILSFWNRFFEQVSPWFVHLAILVVGLATPVTFLMNNFVSARIYEAAITSAQFFFLLGLIFVFMALDKKSSVIPLAVAGICWGLSIGSRQVLIMPIVVLVVLITQYFYRDQRSIFGSFVKIIPLGVPILTALCALSWYNWARFGSIFESGWSYQLAGPNLQKYRDILFSPGYIIQNLYNYLINPVRLTPGFPYLQLEYGRTASLIPFLSLPQLYASQYLVGLIIALPFTIFAVVAFMGLIQRLQFSKRDPGSHSERSQPLVTRLLFLSVAFLCSFVLLLFYFWAAMRFLIDFLPSLILLAIFGYWLGYQLLSSKPALRAWYAAFGIYLALHSIVVSSLIAISVNDARFLLFK